MTGRHGAAVHKLMELAETIEVQRALIRDLRDALQKVDGHVADGHIGYFYEAERRTWAVLIARCDEALK